MQPVAGEHSEPEALVGRRIVIVANLEPATLAAFWGRAGAANAPGRVLDVGWGAAAEAGRPSEQPFA